MKNKSVQIIVLNWNQKQLSLDCIESLKKTSFKKKQIIFVDNASSDGSVGYIRKKHPDIEIIQAPKNLGYAGGNNFGFRSIKNQADYTIFINNDTYVDPDFIEPLIIELENNSNVVQTAPVIFYANQSNKIWYAGGQIFLPFSHIRHRGIRSTNFEKFSFKKKVSYASGCCFCMRTIDFKELGMFDETYGMYCEDVDLSLRVSNAKGSIKVIPKSMIWHHISKSVGGSHSISKWYKKNTSILKLLFKHSNPFFFPLAFVFFMINNLLSLSLVVVSKFLIKK